MRADSEKEAIAVQADEELPVVARMVLELRSDGTRTVARGILEDRVEGERVAIEAAGGSPIELASALMKSLARLPFEASPVSRFKNRLKKLLPGR